MPQASERDDEVRLALVLNGGVSLAIWMGGVTYELDRARRAAFPALPRDEGVGVWEALCAALHTRLTIDVVAGTSAGGLNGAVLAAAIAQRSAMPNLRERWKELGDLGGRLLVRDAGNPARSVLDGEFFEEGVRAVFRGLDQQSTRAGQAVLEDDAPSSVSLTLTATALHGDVTRYLDEAEAPFTQREYRALYRFRRAADPDPGATEPGQVHWVDEFAGAADDLAHAARATASFPGAFAPVYSDASRRPSPPDALAAARNACSLGTADWVMDGGVLDNEPFAPVFEEIRRRPVDRGVRRFLAYLVPAAGGDAAGEPAGDRAVTPGFIGPLWLGTSLPRETNIVDQLAELRRLLARTTVDRGTTERLLDEAAASPDRVRGIADALFPLYRERRYLGGLWQIRELLGAAQSDAVSLRPPPEWRVAPGERVAAPWVPDALTAAPAGSSAWGFGLSAAQDVLRTWFDPLRDAVAIEAGLSGAAARLSVLRARLLALQAAYEEQVCRSRVRPDAGDAAILGAGTAAFAAVVGADGAAIGEIVQLAASTMVEAAELLPTGVGRRLALAGGAQAAVQRQLDVAVVEGTFQPPTLDPPVPRFRFLRMGIDRPPALPVQHGRVLYGLALQHFGAFLRASWRLNDWMWGRLDGASHLARMLLDDARLQELAAADAPGLAAALGAAVGSPEVVRAAVDGLAAGGDDTSDHVATLRQLVERRAQLDVLREELPHLRDELAASPGEQTPDTAAWRQALAAGGEVPDDDAVERAFALYTLGPSDAKTVLDSRAGSRGRRDALLSGLRAVHADDTLPDFARRAAGILGRVVRLAGRWV